jgi:Ni/Fe-hydrogenase subunit HybB-like protein
MSIFQSTLALKIIFISAILNVLLLIMLTLSCRCIPVLSRAGNKLMSHKPFQNFYKLHCYFWLVFWISVIVHMVFAIALVGFPF